MKYIRTKNGIFEVKKVEILCGVKFYDYETREDFVNRIREEQIISQADTIEELCDEFVVASNTPLVKMNPKIQNNMEFEEISQTYVKSKKNSIVYGAIWTSAGLIYVAKMDSEGKLVLI